MPSLFKPARSHGHRIACFALYRSLLRQGRLVSIPDELVNSSTLGPGSPIQWLIRNGFRRNKHEVSPRLVISALKNGYRYLTLLTRAADPSSSDHASILDFIRENQQRLLVRQAKAAEAKSKRISTAPIPDRVPIIIKTSAEGEPPVYAPNIPPRPLSSFPNGVRKPPHLAHANDIPFLRMKKPQPRFLGRVIRQRMERRIDRLNVMYEIDDVLIYDAAAEDEWDEMMEVMLAEKAKQEKRSAGGENTTETEEIQEEEEEETEEPTYQEVLRSVQFHLIEVAEAERKDLVARSQALWEIVQRERALALEEEKERLVREGRGDEEPKLKWSGELHRRRPKKTKKVKEDEKPLSAEEGRKLFAPLENDGELGSGDAGQGGLKLDSDREGTATAIEEKPETELETSPEKTVAADVETVQAELPAQADNSQPKEEEKHKQAHGTESGNAVSVQQAQGQDKPAEKSEVDKHQSVRVDDIDSTLSTGQEAQEQESSTESSEGSKTSSQESSSPETDKK
ncbi:hypothetical protein B0J18DRAFT_493128 [Chaetomium sp. MPI-SDFR-AT-0129]|nr:hypothetical protein B0J18DRAFT_493128 [Chaetomium sp. MPI-SDFR-AT-0129]